MPVGKVDKHYGSSRFVVLLFSCMKLDWTRLFGRADRLLYPIPCQIPDSTKNLSLNRAMYYPISRRVRLFSSSHFVMVLQRADPAICAVPG